MATMGRLPLPVQSNLRVVLLRTRNPLNIGAAARAMGNFGFTQLRVVNPYDLAFRQARSAIGASEILSGAEEYKTLADAVADCGLVVGTTSAGKRELRQPLRKLEAAAGMIRAQSRPVALLFGSEKVGLSKKDLSYCHWLLRISTLESNGSMNLGQAVAVCLYELVRQPGSASEPAEPAGASGADLERLTGVLTEGLSTSGYMTPAALPATEDQVRRLMRRLKPNPADARLLLGMLRHLSRPR